MKPTRDLEQVMVVVALLIVLLATSVDLFEDQDGGATITELILDVLGNSFVAFTLAYILILKPRATKKRNQHLELAMHHSNEDLLRWKSKAASVLKGLGKKINEQFDDWHLSNAEKEVSLFLIKGYSFKEMASMRGTSEKTIRQQASHVYAKAKLDNRSELAAFFLEDLLLPETSSTNENQE